jgi:hypothetical protein
MNWFNVVHKRFDRNEAVAIIFVWRAAHGVAKCGMHPSMLKYLCAHQQQQQQQPSLSVPSKLGDSISVHIYIPLK